MTSQGPGEPNLRDTGATPGSWDSEDTSAPRRLLAVLFTDIVGSTELATALGDRRWRELLEQHDAAVRASIARFGGREVDTAGDSFFTVFDMPFAAVECALDAIHAVRLLGLRIRAGAHMGECVDAGTTVRGVTVHIGARVAAKAGGGELLISNTVRDLLAGSALRFDDRGEHVLKGVDGRWRLFAVQPHVRASEEDLPPIIAIPTPVSGSRGKRRRIAAIVAVVAVLAASVTYVMTRTSGPVAVPADSVAMIEAASGRVVRTVAVRHRPVGVAASGTGVWVANSIDRSVSRISKDRAETIPLDAGPGEMAFGRGLLWVANADAKTVSRINPESSREVGEAIEAGNGLADIAFGGDAVWLAHSLDGTVWKLDPATGKRLASVSVGLGVRGIAASDAGVWAASAASGTALQLDAKSGAVVRVVNVGRGASAVAIGAGGVWVANTLDGTVSRIDAGTGSVRDTIRVGRGPRAIAVVRNRVFVANEIDGTISMIDGRGAVRTIDIANAPMGLASDGAHVWVSVRGGIERYRGGTLRVGSAGVPDTIDPGANFSPVGFAISPAVYDGLVSFKKVGGVEGSEVVPNLAEEIRAPTDGGKTYSFTLREGLRYSDGSPVRASDVRATFERIFEAKGDFYGKVLLGVLVGGDRCASPKPCDLSSAVVTDDAARTVVIKLRLPFADFPATLAHPGLSILPATAPADDAKFTPIPGTGPYRIADVAKDRSLITLDRNPHFRQRGLAQPDGYADRIEIRLGGTPEEQVQAVRDGRSDWTLDLLDPGAQYAEVATEAASQVHLYDVPSVLFAGLNVRVPPFNDVRARRALNFALDRRAVTARGAGQYGDLTCQALGKNIIGYRPYCPYTSSPNAAGVWRAPDLTTAQRLVRESGTAGQSVGVWVASGAEPVLAREQERVAGFFVEALRAIGYQAAVRRMPGDDYFGALLQPDSTHQVALSGWVSDYPAASGFLIPLLLCPETFTRVTGLPADMRFNITGYCSRSIDDKIEAALAGDPAVVAERWHQIDRLITDDAPWVPHGTYRGAAFVSKRVGNVLANGMYGPLMSQMWVAEPRRAG